MSAINPENRTVVRRQSSELTASGPVVGKVLARMVGDSLDSARAMVPLRSEAIADADDPEALIREGERAFDLCKDDKKKGVEAFGLFSKAAAAGRPAAYYWLGECYHCGVGVKLDESQAVRWFELASALDHTPAMISLGFAHLHGFGVSENSTEGLSWLKKAAEMGDAEAMVWLGHYYEVDLEDTPQNEAESIAWYQRAADLGNIRGYTCLGRALLNRGRIRWKVSGWPADVVSDMTARLEQDSTDDCLKAAVMFRNAADAGDFAGQLNLGRCYATGEGVRQDYAKAYMWFSLSAEHKAGLPAAGRLELEKLVPKMSQSEIQQGKKFLLERKTGGSSFKGA